MTLFRCAVCFFLLAALPVASAGDVEAKPLFTILYTAESHAALLPCDCPLQPLGGVARRATLIKRFRERGPVLLLDGDGWAAGGIYDEDSDGEPARDALRTQLMRDAMSAMKYDSESSEATGTRDFTLQAHKIRVVHLNQTKVVDATITEKDALVLAISRLGEEANETLARTTKPDLILNAGRKNTQRVGWRLGSTTLVNFDYQARNLVVIEAFPAKAESGLRYEFRARLEPLGKEIPDDPEIAALLAPHRDALAKKGKRRIEIEYWMMPDCPHCKLARTVLQRLSKEMADRVTIVPHWLVDLRGNELTSMHGDDELNESRVQAVIAKYYPEKIWEWLEWRAEHREVWTVGAEKLGLLTARIEQALNAKEGDKLLKAEYDLAERRQIRGTPSLVIGNRPYKGEIDRAHVLGTLCGTLEEPKPECCKEAPACFIDFECRKRGYIARCVDAGTPKARCDTSKPAVKIPATILVDRDALANNLDVILEGLLGDLPGLDYTLLDVSMPEGKSLAERANVTRLPAYLLDPIAATEVGYAESVGRYAKLISLRGERGGEQKLIQLREDRFGVGANRILARPRIKGRADLFVSRFVSRNGKRGQEALETALECEKSPEARGLKLVLHDIVYFKPTEVGAAPQLAANNGIAEMEEVARAMAVRLSAPEKLNAYLIERGTNLNSTYWDVPLKKVGLDPQRIRDLAENPSAELLHALNVEAELLKSLDAGGEIVLLAENCELISVASRNDLRQILERIAGRK